MVHKKNLFIQYNIYHFSAPPANLNHQLTPQQQVQILEFIQQGQGQGQSREGGQYLDPSIMLSFDPDLPPSYDETVKENSANSSNPI